MPKSSAWSGGTLFEIGLQRLASTVDFQHKSFTILAGPVRPPRSLLHGLNGENLSLFNETAVSPILRMLTFLNAFSLISSVLGVVTYALDSLNDWIFKGRIHQPAAGI